MIRSLTGTRALASLGALLLGCALGSSPNEGDPTLSEDASVVAPLREATLAEQVDPRCATMRARHARDLPSAAQVAAWDQPAATLEACIGQATHRFEAMHALSLLATLPGADAHAALQRVAERPDVAASVREAAARALSQSTPPR